MSWYNDWFWWVTTWVYIEFCKGGFQFLMVWQFMGGTKCQPRRRKRLRGKVRRGGEFWDMKCPRSNSREYLSIYNTFCWLNLGPFCYMNFWKKKNLDHVLNMRSSSYDILITYNYAKTIILNSTYFISHVEVIITQYVCMQLYLTDV